MLHFLDICNYSAPGASYSHYLKTYGQDPDLAKSFFPYEAVTSLEVLDQEGMPSYNAFYSSLKGYNTLEEDGGGLSVGLKNYNTLHLAWKQQGMKTLRDLLIFYNNMDVGPFLKALENQLLTYRSMGLDLFKDACTLPGQSLRLGMRGLGGVFYTLGDDMADIHDLIRKNMVGGLPSFSPDLLRLEIPEFVHANMVTKRRRYASPSLVLMQICCTPIVCHKRCPWALALPGKAQTSPLCTRWTRALATAWHRWNGWSS